MVAGLLPNLMNTARPYQPARTGHHDGVGSRLYFDNDLIIEYFWRPSPTASQLTLTLLLGPGSQLVPVVVGMLPNLMNIARPYFQPAS